MFYKISSRNKPQIRLICFSYAGGSTHAFSGWSNCLPDSVELWLVKLPGHGVDLLTPPISSMEEIVAKLIEYTPQFDIPYILLGHSLGAKIAFEYMKSLAKSGFALPCYFIASASSAPTLTSQMYSKYPLDEAQIVEELGVLGGTPPEILQSKELMSLLMPSLLADFNIAASYRDTEGFSVSIPLCLMAGEQDMRIDLAELPAWKQSFNGTCQTHIVDDGHFFIETSRDWYLSVLNDVIDMCIEL